MLDVDLHSIETTGLRLWVHYDECRDHLVLATFASLSLRENSSYGEPLCILVSLCNTLALDEAVLQNYGVNVLVY